jgi:Flp pilus assembly protein TadB
VTNGFWSSPVEKRDALLKDHLHPNESLAISKNEDPQSDAPLTKMEIEALRPRANEWHSRDHHLFHEQASLWVLGGGSIATGALLALHFHPMLTLGMLGICGMAGLVVFLRKRAQKKRFQEVAERKELDVVERRELNE